jgi:hypothetical protein
MDLDNRSVDRFKAYHPKESASSNSPQVNAGIDLYFLDGIRISAHCSTGSR